MSPATKTSLEDEFLTDYELYADVCLKIRTKHGQLIPLEFNRAQRIVGEKIGAQYQATGRVRAIILKARQTGISTWIAGRYYRRASMVPNQNALILADKKERGSTLFEIYDRFYRNTPEELRPEKRFETKGKLLHFDVADARERIQRPGLDSKIWVETAGDPNAGRASTVQMLHASELAFWASAKEVWTSLAQAVPRTGDSEVIVESTANGVGNFFHQRWEVAEAGESEYIAIFLPWWIHEEYQIPLPEEERQGLLETLSEREGEYLDVGIEFEGEMHRLSPEQLAWRRAEIRDELAGDERKFRQEYPANPREAFLVSGNGFFDEEMLQVYEGKVALPIMRGDITNDIKGGFRVRPGEQGNLRLWEWPDPKGVYVVSADVAMGRQVTSPGSDPNDPDHERGGRDFSSADVIRVDDGFKLVAQLHARLAPEVFAEQIFMLGYLYASPGQEGSRSVRWPSLLAPEKNHSSGETVIKWLKDAGYPNLYRRRQIGRIKDRVGDVYGWLTTVETRRPMLDKLAALIRNEQIDIPCADTLKEMRTFILNPDGKPEAQEGCHDDRVISLGIGCFVAETQSLHYSRPTYPKTPEPEWADSPTGWTNYHEE